MAASDRRYAFLEAALEGDLTKLKGFALEIGNGRDLTKIVDSEGTNALIRAAASGSTHVCKYLLENLKFDFDPQDRHGNTPLIAAIERDHHPTAVYLIENGAKIDRTNSGGCTALHCAAKKGQMEIMRLLLSKGANPVPDLSTTKAMTPLQCACWQGEEKLCWKGKTEAVKLLLENGADPNAFLEYEFTPLMLAVIAESMERVELLLKAGADPSLCSSGNAPLIIAACKEDTRILKRLLKAGANPDVTDAYRLMTPIQHAAYRFNVDAMKLLFPVSSRIPSIPDWSVDGIMKYVSSKEAMDQWMIRQRDYYEILKAKGREAVERKDYYEAIRWYTEAEKVVVFREEVFSNRSFCWLKLNQGQKALNDAKTCVEVNPDWPKGHYRVGAAQMFLHDYSKAAEAFAKALRLDPQNMDIKKAYREAVGAELAARMSRSSVS